MRSRLLRHVLTAGLMLTAVGCGSSDDDAAPTTAASSDASATSTSSTPTTTATTTTDDDLPGEPIDFGPQPGDELVVMGVAHDDVLNVRSEPGDDADIVATLDPISTGVTAQGNTRNLPQSLWAEVAVDGTVGWADLASLAYAGAVADETSAIILRLGETPTAPDVAALGLTVAETYASIDPPSRIEMVVEPTIGDLAEVTYDVVGLGDDALAGLRVHVFAASEDDGATWGLKSVEVTSLCGRGVVDGLCV